ncbi:tetratricopeptide repeat protein 39C-like [Anoplophora glabripennis]|uniref:tetratricopeptide repeat protein 39C-like n=1 Tax=Anoplophora glabripennis TaxID=217634 RepID=UPI000C75AD6A|nr:tetratricopeptide repeat protein 39C-like [Anoplophora glabripennis]
MASCNDNVPENSGPSETDNKNKVPEWILAKQGINLIINNNSTDAKNLFLQYPDSLVMFAGYSFAMFMDALMSFEEDKLNLAISTLKDVEKRCVAETGWLRQMIPRVFGRSEPPKPLAEQLETQIILADSQVCIGILTFLQQDFSGYFKAGWVLRKAWKVYQKVYKEILALYTEHIGELHLPDPSNITEASSSSLTQSLSEIAAAWDIPESPPANGYIPFSTIPHSKSAILHKTPNGTCLNPSKGSTFEEQAVNNRHLSFIKKSTSTNSGLTSYSTNGSLWSSKLNPFQNSLSLHSFPSLNIFPSQGNIQDRQIERKVIERLMAAVSFGFGLFQLGISLLPPSLLRLTNILGFAANKQNGIACLMYARLGVDMRTPLATLALLWYHTIVRPFYAVDGNNVQAGVDIANALLKESDGEYGKSALFLFFGGRVSRLNSDINSALKYFQEAAENANQREIKLLSLHEVGWCHLIELDYCAAESVFAYLHTSSRWSRSFYAYLAAICSGACQNSLSFNLFQDLLKCVSSASKINQLDEFLNKRSKRCPSDFEEIKSKRAIYWKLLVFEMLYLWNALPSCTTSNCSKIINDCATIVDLQKDEPMKGLSKLILGCAYCNSGQIELGIENFRKCLDMRQGLAPNLEDAHISAFAQYELGAHLLRNEETKQEGKTLLQQMNRYSKYDFEQKLTIRVYSLLRNLS